jgi:hypothetical protein
LRFALHILKQSYIKAKALWKPTFNREAEIRTTFRHVFYERFLSLKCGMETSFS